MFSIISLATSGRSRSRFRLNRKALLLEDSTMILTLLFGCLLLAPTVSSQKKAVGSTAQLVDGASQFDALVEAMMEAERRQEQSFAAEDSDISRLGTTPDQHHRFRTSRRSSVTRGRLHRINVIRAMVALQSNISDIPLTSDPVEELECKREHPYRTANGSCNNLKHTRWGMASIPMRRWLPAEYDDGIAAPRTKSIVRMKNKSEKLPSPRLISTTVHPHSSADTERSEYTHILMQWGQFLDHDLTRTPIQELLDGPYDMSVACCDKKGNKPYWRPQCMPIEIPQKDRSFKTRCMNFVRSIQVENAKGLLCPVDQINEITAFIDASQVYGSSEEEQKELRSFSMGDDRVNENPILQSMHTIFMREHNRIAKDLLTLNPHWGDEVVFQEARKIVGAIMQKITYGDYLPIVVGPRTMRRYRLRLAKSGYVSLYRNWTDASIRNVFATAALRMGHSMINDAMGSYSKSYSHLGDDILSTVFGNTSSLLSSTGKLGHLCRGLVEDSAQNVDRMFSPQITDHLFPDAEGRRLDLVALNIQRGRDHALPAYTKWRRFCRVWPRVRSFTDLKRTHSRKTIRRLQSVYASVHDVDLFPAAIAENPLCGGMVGPTFACLLGKQFRNLKRGDRMWFEENSAFVNFTPRQLTEIRKASLSRVICDNTDTTTIQKNAFRVEERAPCDTLDTISLNPWLDKPDK